MHSLNRLFRTAIAVVLFLAVAALLTHNSSSAAPSKSTAPARGYYLTKTQHTGSQALAACASGYHVASVWEIHETSNLSYETNLGITTDDSGSGPPTHFTGWVRTGTNSAGADQIPAGIVNCFTWTSDSTQDYGTFVSLTPDGTSTVINLINPWVFGKTQCSTANAVWCVQD